ncbi:MAG: T9SS type A sorting domain-containing protein, partial [Bacteroidota bacterium]
GDYGGYEILEVARDRAGRLILATDGGVWRSEEGVVAVASEAEAPGKPAEAFVLGVPYPNPTATSVAVPLALPETAEVRVAVVDLLGREVAVLAEGRRAAGTHALAFETGGLAPGVYVVQAVVATAGGTQPFQETFTVVR